MVLSGMCPWCVWGLVRDETLENTGLSYMSYHFFKNYFY